MGPDEESKSEAPPSETAGPRVNPRGVRGRSRGGRGRGRGRGRGARPKPPQAEPPAGADMEGEVGQAEPEAIFELAQQPGQEIQAVESSRERPEPTPEPVASTSLSPPAQPATPANVEQAIEEVSGVIDALRGALEEMEEVLELLEVFERQKNADEREIDSLRRALRQMHRPRDGGHHPHR